MDSKLSTKARSGPSSKPPLRPRASTKMQPLGSVTKTVPSNITLAGSENMRPRQPAASIPVIPPSRHHREQTVRRIKEIWTPIIRSNDPYISNDMLEAFRVRISLISFTTGKPEDDSQIFLKPLSPILINQALNRSRPWNRSGPQWKMPICPLSSNEWQARRFCFHFEELLCSSNHDDALPLVETTKWRCRG